MNITRFEHIEIDDLLSRFKKVRLKGHGRPFIYEHAQLDLLQQVDPKTLFPAQRYVLKSDHWRLLELYHSFQEFSVDIFSLKGALLFWVKNPGEPEEGPIPLTPPMIELSLESDGRTIPLINDGMHRVFTAMELNKTINIIQATHVPTQYPYYAYGLEKGWQDVTLLDELPDDFVKKTYRDPTHYKALFRDFNEIFPGIQKQRKQSNPSHIQAYNGFFQPEIINPKIAQSETTAGHALS